MLGSSNASANGFTVEGKDLGVWLEANVRVDAPETLAGIEDCFAGSGSNVFDALTAMEGWVERDDAPDAIIAYKFKGNKPGPDKPIKRSMPLRLFPQMARCDGKGQRQRGRKLVLRCR